MKRKMSLVESFTIFFILFISTGGIIGFGLFAKSMFTSSKIITKVVEFGFIDVILLILGIFSTFICIGFILILLVILRYVWFEFNQHKEN